MSGKLVVGSVLCLAWSGAVAADLPSRAAAPSPVSGSNVTTSWAGSYFGLVAGASFSTRDFGYSVSDPTGGAPFTTRSFARCVAPGGVAVPVITSPNSFDISTDCVNGSSFQGGAKVGYNWQLVSWVVGVEADGIWRSLLNKEFGVFGDNPTSGSPMGSFKSDVGYLRSTQGSLITLRARVGYDFNGTLLYVTGGAALGKTAFRLTEVLSPGGSCVSPSVSACRTTVTSSTKFGWTFGGDLEKMLHANWSVGAEYLYADLGRSNVSRASTAGIFVNVSEANQSNSSHNMRLNLKYHFN